MHVFDFIRPVYTALAREANKVVYQAYFQRPWEEGSDCFINLWNVNLVNGDDRYTWSWLNDANNVTSTDMAILHDFREAVRERGMDGNFNDFILDELLAASNNVMEQLTREQISCEASFV